MNQITRFEFENKPLTFEKVNGEWWANGDEAADALGYSDRKKVLTLYRRHKGEFMPSEATNLTSRSVDGKSRKITVFSPKGLEHLAILGRTATCRRFRRWLLDHVLESLRDGARLVTPEQLADGLAKIEARYERQVAMLMGTINTMAAQNNALAGAVSVQASSAGKLLAYIAHSPEARAALEAARDKTAPLPFPEPFNRLDGLPTGGCD